PQRQVAADRAPEACQFNDAKRASSKPSALAPVTSADQRSRSRRLTLADLALASNRTESFAGSQGPNTRYTLSHVPRFQSSRQAESASIAMLAVGDNTGRTAPKESRLYKTWPFASKQRDGSSISSLSANFSAYRVPGAGRSPCSSCSRRVDTRRSRATLSLSAGRNRYATSRGSPNE